MRTLSFIVSCLLLAGSGALLAAETSAQASGSAQQNTSVTADRSGASAAHSNAASTSATSNQAQGQLAQGSEINATLSKPVDSRRSKPGDPVTAMTTHDTQSNGQVIIPRHSKLLGHVTEARTRGGAQGGSSGAASPGNSATATGSADSALGIVFDQAVLKDGRTVPINGTVQAVATSSSSAAGELDGPASNLGTSASGAGSGSASGGGLLGNAAGGLTGTVGGTVNATAGGVTSVLTRSPGAVGGLNGAGRLTSGSHGIFGLDGYSLTSAANGGAEGSLITSAGRSVHLDSGTQLLLVSGAQTTGNVAKTEAPAPAAQKKPTDTR